MAQNQRIVQEVSRCVKTSQEVTTCLALALEFLFGFVPLLHQVKIQYDAWPCHPGKAQLAPQTQHRCGNQGDLNQVFFPDGNTEWFASSSISARVIARPWLKLSNAVKIAFK